MKAETPLFRALSPKMVSKALQTFDRATTIVVGTCWGAALLMIVFALYTVSLSASTKRATEEALVAEPILPKIVRGPIEAHDAQQLTERLKHRYPEITFSLGADQSLTISSNDGNKFHEWLAVLSYIDTISPQYRWMVKDLCVGKCVASGLMRATLTGEKVSFEAPPDDKH
jgi:hypothetical protein